MKLIRSFAAAIAVACSLSSMASAQGPRNFVLLNPRPVGDATFYQPQFIDTASVRRDRDTIFVDLLRVNWLQALVHQGSVAEPPRLIGVIVHLRLSCAVWASGEIGENNSYDSDGNPQRGFGSTSRSSAIVDAKGHDVGYLDTICAGGALSADKGLPSVQAAMAWAKQNTTPPGPRPMVFAPRIPAPPTVAAWMAGQVPHQFVPVEAPMAFGASLYLDVANLKREGAMVDGLSLLVLGSEDQRGGTSMGPVVALRRVTYDCARPAMTVRAQATWTRYGEYEGDAEDGFAPRLAGVSSTVAREISAACAPEKLASGSSFASVEDAWAHARSFWQPFQSPALKQASCIWNGLSSDYRQGVTAYIIAHPGAEIGLQEGADIPVLQACGVQSVNPVMQYGLARYNLRQAAIDALKSGRNLSDADIYGLWKKISWEDRQLLIRVQRGSTAQERSNADAIIVKATASSGFTAPSDRIVFKEFLDGEAFFEVD
jgi:hypothetical protein